MDAVKDALVQVQKVDIKARRLVDGLLQGAHMSVFKGRGIEFTETRQYVPGDDIRSIDWNVTARMNHPYVKEFIEERDVGIYLLFDVSASCDFGADKAKKHAAIELAASIMAAAMRTNDRVGLLIFSEGVEKFLPPKKGRRHVLAMLNNLCSCAPKRCGTDVANALSYISLRAKCRSMVFILSDFMCDDFSKQLRLLAAKHDVIAVNVADPRELELPDVGLIELEDFETGEQMLVDTSDADFRQEYYRLAHDRARELGRMFRRTGTDSFTLSSAVHHGKLLKQFFYRRRRTSRRGG